MIIGVPKEVKVQESRVALTPEGAEALVDVGHRVLLEKTAGRGSGFSDHEYRKMGARIVTQEEAWSADIVLKVKEPIEEEFDFFRAGLVVFEYLHLASASGRQLTRQLKSSGVTAIDYSTVQLPDGSLPLLRPMSEISGKLAIRKAAQIREEEFGLLLGGTSKVAPEQVLILGGGNVGVNAAEEALGMDARVTVLDSNPERVAWLREHLRHFIKPQNAYSVIRYQQLACEIQSKERLERLLPFCDVVIGSVLKPGAVAPKIVTRRMVKSMKEGSVIVDVSIDQGGCIATSHETDHNKPTFREYGVLHYCVTNIPGIVPRTSTIALTNETLSYILEIANKGIVRAVQENPALALGVNVYKGKTTNEALARALRHKYTPLEEVL